ncbi:LamG-like jellyroll fold domain-containing protein [Luteolibacter marinus]|uniref:LamG-like jellyroll fold domain-containing protein n=1 Tax=Luteolibacter marinus TaxID=2776705 RepID=UPI001866315F|nr:LamG-like jellyroll fold domain-containing protein [Luteolibacter marinus]
MAPPTRIHRSAGAKWPASLLAGALLAPLHGQDLAHRWSFDTLADSAGSADAVLVGTASLSGTGSLTLPGGGTRTNHATVPIGSTIAGLSSMTVDTWFTMNAQQDWSKVWMFGTTLGSSNASPYIDLTPRAGTGGNPPSAGFKAAGTNAESNTRNDPNPAALATATEYHATVVFDADKDTISLYLDGTLADSTTWTGQISDLGNTVDNFIGAPVFYNDANFNGSVNEMRIWDGALSPGKVMAYHSAGADSVPANDPALSVSNTSTSSPGGAIVVEIPVHNVGDSLPLTISSIELSGVDADYFSAPASYPENIPAGESGILQVNFDPEFFSGNFNVDVLIHSNDNLDPDQTIHLTVNVSEPDAVYTANFSTVANTEGEQAYEITVTNNSTAALEIYDGVILATAAAPHYHQRFAVDHDFVGSGAIVIPAGEVGAVPVTFDPTGLGAGAKAAIVSLQTNEFDNFLPEIPVSVEVTGTVDDGPTALAHRWSFDDATDSVGAADVVLNGTASIGSGSLTLPGTAVRSDYAEIPIGETLATSNSVTIETWFTIAEAGETWRKLWMFGCMQDSEANSVWMDFTPYSGDPAAAPSSSAKAPGFQGTTRADGGPPELSVGQEHHSAVVFDAGVGQILLYIDGALVDSGPMTGAVHQIGITDNNYLGAAVFFGDADWKGSINEMRVWKGALSSTDVAASHTGGPANVIEPGAAPVEPFAVAGVSIVGGQVTLTISGMSPGQQYHLETGISLDDFATVEGSTFTAGEAVPTVPADGPRRFVRVVEGPEPVAP